MNGVLQQFLDSYDVLQESYGVLSSDLAHELCKLVMASVAARLDLRETQGYAACSRPMFCLRFLFAIYPPNNCTIGKT